ncbi:M12 family metallo-peptidase [Nocardioides sp. SR21]|uniref:M12 family metallo-peptidase n=1 Tax=Nocardioides sp. SR21 TaxID=2919501 RepID=UPI001FA99428|nr:M12 family metallo-peptidase [Nocardioides sp. SR21]
MNSRIAALVAAAALGTGLLGAVPTADAVATITASCGDPVLREPVRLQTAVAGIGLSDATQDEALDAARDALDEPLTELDDDASLWLDACAAPFYVERARPARAATSNGLVAPLANTFMLSSRPGAARTIYLDFLGEVVTSTSWNGTYGATINATPFTLDGTTSTSFSDAELTAVQQAWQIVAEDYAPFDVNVTTQDPGAAAITRSSSADTQYGIRVVVTNGGPIASKCGCGGVAYVGTFDATGDAYNVAWAFANAAGMSGKGIGEVAAHEAGHTFGLHHDGTASVTYYSGSSPWAPIMGSGYGQPVTQWSKGEYTGANNPEDDLSIIAAKIPVLADDHGDTVGTATAVATGATKKGLIGATADVDAFSVDPDQSLTVSATPTTYADLDIRLRVLDGSGTVLNTVNPAATRASESFATGMDATWTGTGAATVLVEGVGATSYSDYASLGAYTLTVADGDGTTPTPDPDPEDATPLAADGAKVYTVVNRAIDVKLPVTGGSGTYGWTPKPSKNWPTWLTLTSDGRLTGTPTTTTTVSQSANVTDGTTTLTVPIRISPVAVAAPAAGQTLALSLTSASMRAKQPFSRQLSATGGTGTVTYKYRGLPPGLRLNTAGLLSGTPTAGGVYVATITASTGTKATGIHSVTSTMTFTISWPFLVPVSNSLKAIATKKSTGRLKITGGNGKYAWSGSELPTGVTLAANGTLTVLATAAGTLTGTATVASGEYVAAVPFSITVAPPPLQWVGTNATLSGTAGQAASLAMTVTGGTAPYRWQAGGALPSGLTLTGTDTATVTLAGTVSAPLSTYLNLTAYDAAGKKLTRRVRILVR